MIEQNGKQAKKQVVNTAMNYRTVDLYPCISIVVLTCCRKSVLTY